MKAFNEPAVAGGSIKPRVERSGPLGYGRFDSNSPRRGRQRAALKPLSPVPRALQILTSFKPGAALRSTLGFMLPPAIAGSSSGSINVAAKPAE